MKSFQDKDIQAFLKTTKGKSMNKVYNEIVKERAKTQEKLDKLDEKMHKKFNDICSEAGKYWAKNFKF